MYLGMALFVLGVGLGQGWSVTIALLPFASAAVLRVNLR